MAKAAVVPSAKAAVVGNKTTEVIIGTAASKLASAVTNLQSAVEEAGKLQSTIEENTLQVVSLEAKIEGLQQDLQNKQAQNKIDIQNRFNTDQESFVKSWLQSNGYTMIYTNELAGLKADLKDTKANTEAMIKNAVTANTELLNNSHNSEIKTLKLTHEKDQAENNAKITLMNEKMTFLEIQAKDWKTAADEARKAIVEVSKGNAVTQNFSGNGK